MNPALALPLYHQVPKLQLLKSKLQQAENPEIEKYHKVTVSKPVLKGPSNKPFLTYSRRERENNNN